MRLRTPASLSPGYRSQFVAGVPEFHTDKDRAAIRPLSLTLVDSGAVW